MRAPGSVASCLAKYNQAAIEEQIRGAALPVDEGAEMEGVEEEMFDGLGLEEHIRQAGKTTKRVRGKSPTSPTKEILESATRRRRLEVGAYLIPPELKPIAEHKLLGNFIGAYLLSLPAELPVGAIKRVYESSDGSALLTDWDHSRLSAPPPQIDNKGGSKRARAAECQATGTKSIVVQSRIGQGPRTVLIQASWLEKFEKCKADPPRLLKGVLKAIGTYEEFKRSWNLKTAKFVE